MATVAGAADRLLAELVMVGDVTVVAAVLWVDVMAVAAMARDALAMRVEEMDEDAQVTRVLDAEAAPDVAVLRVFAAPDAPVVALSDRLLRVPRGAEAAEQAERPSV